MRFLTIKQARMQLSKLRKKAITKSIMQEANFEYVYDQGCKISSQQKGRKQDLI